MGADWSLITTIPETVDLLDEVSEPHLKMLFDTWHLWDTPGVLEDIRRYADRFAGVHVNDWREPTRSWADRLPPGEGVMDLPAIFGALEAASYDGWYDLEIFSMTARSARRMPIRCGRSIPWNWSSGDETGSCARGRRREIGDMIRSVAGTIDVRPPSTSVAMPGAKPGQ